MRPLFFPWLADIFCFSFSWFSVFVLMFVVVYLPVSDDCMPKSPVELQRLPRPACAACGRGDGDGAGDIELLLGESECMEPFDWCIDFVRLCVRPPPCAIAAELWRRDRPSGVLLDARAIGLRNFQSLAVLFDNDDDELLCVGLCDVTEMGDLQEQWLQTFGSACACVLSNVYTLQLICYVRILMFILTSIES